MASGRIAETLHLKEADLIKAASEDVNNVTIVSCALRQIIIELKRWVN